MVAALDLISAPVPLLHTTDVTTQVGLSGDDPLARGRVEDRFRVLVSFYDAAGGLEERRELEPIGPGERRFEDLSAMAPPACRDADVLAVVHRIPMSVLPSGDPTTDVAASPGEYELYRTMLQVTRHGGSGSVIYETPPGLNAGRRSDALMFTSMGVTGPANDTEICVLHHSVDPGYDRTAAVELRVFDPAGREVADGRLELGPFRVARASVADLVGGRADDVRTWSVVAWSADAALIFLALQRNDACGSIAVEHTHPPQAYLLPAEMPRRSSLKSAAIAAWSRR